jgi:hypothetical protein
MGMSPLFNLARYSAIIVAGSGYALQVLARKYFPIQLPFDAHCGLFAPIPHAGCSLNLRKFELTFHLYNILDL